MFRRYTLVRQHGESDCGAAALASIARHHRIPISLQRLRDLTGTDRGGANLLGLAEAAERLGLSARGVKGPYEALPTVPLPCVALITTDEGLGHFVVLHRAGKRSVVLGDPARGVRRLSRDEFRRAWTGCLLIAVPGRAPGLGSPGAAPAGPGRSLLSLFGKHRGVLAEAFACALIMTALGVATAYFVQHLVDSVLPRGEGRLLNALGVGMVVVVLIRALFGLIRQYLGAYVGRKIDLELIADYARHVLRLPLSFFETRRIGEIIARVGDARKVNDAIGGTTLTALVDGTLVVLLTGALWLHDARLAAVASAFVPVLILAVLAHHPAARRSAHAAMEQAAGLSAHLVEDVSGVEAIKAFGAERARAEQGEDQLVRYVQAGYRLEMLGLSLQTLAGLVTAIAGVVVLWYGGHRVIAGALTIGQLICFYTLLNSLLDPLQRLAAANLTLQDALVAIDRLGQVMGLEAEAASSDGRLPFDGPREAIELRGVSFRYGCRGPVLRGLDLRIPAGRTLAVVGESGSGKSTLLKLLMGFYDPTQGRILVDGVDRRDFDLASWREGIGLVAQDPFLFTGTIAANIALGRPQTTRSEVIAAARTAGLDEFIAGLPQRYETVIGERGANLSGGQRQRLAIARAVLRRPEVLIFDEATSHLDTATERAIQESLRTALAGRTVVLVAHRLSTIKDADRIVVLHEGRVVEQGTHQDLMVQEGRYWALWRSQADEGRAAGRAAQSPARAAGSCPSLAQRPDIRANGAPGRHPFSWGEDDDA